jgi:hypothetical protein
MNEGRDPEAWRGLVTLMRYGLFDERSRVKVRLPEGAAPTSMLGNYASLLHAMAAPGEYPGSRNGSPSRRPTTPVVSLRERFADLAALKVNLNLPDAKKRTPLHYAAITDNARAVRALLEAGASASVSDAMGDTPLLSAIKFGAVKAIPLLAGIKDDETRALGVASFFKGPATQSEIRIVLDRYPDQMEVFYPRVEIARVKREVRDKEWSALHWAASMVNKGGDQSLATLVEFISRHCSEMSAWRSSISRPKKAKLRHCRSLYEHETRRKCLRSLRQGPTPIGFPAPTSTPCIWPQPGVILR